jgi:uncharacterized membrane protein
MRKKFSPVRNVNKISKDGLSFTDRIAVAATGVVGTMGFFFFCIIMVTLPLIYRDTMPVIQYISSRYLQLIFQPLIMVGQNLQSKHSELRAENDYQINLKAEHEIEVLYKHLEYQNAILITMMKKMDISMDEVLQYSTEIYTEINKNNPDKLS